MIKPSTILILPACLTLAACGGGGGGALGPVTFTSFSTIPKPGQVQFTGASVEGDFTTNSSSLVTNVVNQQAGAVNVLATYDAAGVQTAGDIKGTRSSLSFGASDPVYNMVTLGLPGGKLVTSAYGTTAAAFANPTDLGNNYQNFGVWETGVNAGAGRVGAASLGAATPAASVPTSGTANFSGNAIGVHIDSAGNNYVTASTVALAANFGARTVDLTSSNTKKYNLNTRSVYNFSASNLNLSGTLSYSAGSNSFSGSVQTANGLTGTASGSFYGPAATEVGGTFSTKAATGVENYMGAFGAKR